MNALKRYFDVYRGLSQSLYILFFATIINSMGMFVFPFLTLYLTGRLAMTQEKAGFFIMMLNLVYGPASLVGGKLADSFGRKRLMVFAQVLSGLCYIPCGFPSVGSNIRWFLLASVFFDGLTDPARSAMMTDLTSPKTDARLFSLIYLGHNLGFAVGMLLAGFLFENYTSWLFWGNAIAIFVAITLVGLKVTETKPTRGQIEKSFGTGRQDEAHRGNIIQALLSRPNLIIFTMLTGLYGFVYAQHRFILPLQTKEFFGASGSVIYGTLMTLNAAMVIVLSTPIMTITQHWKPINAVALSGLLYALGFGFIGLRPSIMLIYITTAIWTLGEIVLATNEGTYVANSTPISHRARFQAFLPLLGGIGLTISPPIVGSFTDHFGLKMAWPLLGAIAAVASLSIYYLGVMEEKANKK